MSDKRFRMFAGPNGSGKTTLIEQIGQQFNLGYFINADLIQKNLETQGYLECIKYCNAEVLHSDWEDFMFANQTDARMVQVSQHGISLRDNILVSKKEISSYVASVIALFFITQLMKGDVTFSFETVMSHQSKVDLLDKVKKAGFKIYLYYVCTIDPEINKQRVLNRVKKGGHPVDMLKIETRYYRSLGLLYNAFLMADRAFIMDSTDEPGTIVLEKNGNHIHMLNEDIPEWVEEYLLDKLTQNLQI